MSRDKVTYPRPEPKFEAGKMVDVFGYAEIIEDRHWSEMWGKWMYRFENQDGRTPETEVSEYNAETQHRRF